MADAPLQLFTYKIVYKQSELIETIIASSQDIAWAAVKNKTPVQYLLFLIGFGIALNQSCLLLEI
jgi:hypothetical protein